MNGRQLLIVVLAALMLAGCDVNPAERVSTGNDLYNREDYLGALGAYQSAQVVLPDMPVPYFNAASAYAQSGQLERAIAALQKTLELGSQPLVEKAYYNLGNVYFMMSRFADAIQAYQQILLLNPDDQDARYNLELALRRSALPTPAPTGEPPEAAPQPTPTSSAVGQNSPTPDGDTLSPHPTDAATQEMAPPSVETLTAAQAEQLLDSIQRNQQTLRDRLHRLTPQADPPENDW